ncbi:MAG: succinoglycan transport protein [Hyphomicrobiales bacterium]|nr:succinoglycan transport protein [Hyphomicrobiales bacterium]
MDAGVEFPPHKVGWGHEDLLHKLGRFNPAFRSNVFDYDDMVAASNTDVPLPFTVLKGVCPSWDNAARKPENGLVYIGATPEKFGRWVEQACRQTLANNGPDERIVFVNAWNEWAEGAHLEPDRHFGYAWLAQTREVHHRLQCESDVPLTSGTPPPAGFTRLRRRLSRAWRSAISTPRVVETSLEDIGAAATSGIFWSVVQTWGARAFTFILFVLLARVLSPTDFGVASAALALLTFAGTMAEFGFGDAIVQRRGLSDEDINLPFYVAVAGSACLAVAAAVGSGALEHALNVPGLAPVVVALAASAPRNTLSTFQEVSYRRQMAFRPLALRIFAANLAAGPAAIICAYAGLGVWSLVVQAYVAAVVGLLWLWRKPVWFPGLVLRTQSFRELARFGASLALMRLIDFAGTRFPDVLILARYGVEAFGLFTVGAKLSQVLMQLLQSALNDVSLSVLSRLSHDRARMAEIYLRAMTMAVYVAAPLFVCAAALAPEICAVLFGARWTGVDEIARPLLLLGALQCVQFLNGPYMSARGRPSAVLLVAIVKHSIVAAGLLLLPKGDVAWMVTLFALLQVAAAPVSFGLALGELGLVPRLLLAVLWPAVMACFIADRAVAVLRPLAHTGSPLVDGPVLGLAFALSFAAVVIVFGRKQVGAIRAFAQSRWKARTL